MCESFCGQREPALLARVSQEAAGPLGGFCSASFRRARGARREGTGRCARSRARGNPATREGARGGPLLGFVAWRSQELAQKPQRIGLELNELQPDVEASDRAGWQALYPNHLGRVSNGRNIRKKELHLQQLADLEVVVTEDADTAEADVDGLPLASKELHPGGPAIERRTNATILSAVLIVFGHLERH